MDLIDLINFLVCLSSLVGDGWLSVSHYFSRGAIFLNFGKSLNN